MTPPFVNPDGVLLPAEPVAPGGAATSPRRGAVGLGNDGNATAGAFVRRTNVFVRDRSRRCISFSRFVETALVAPGKGDGASWASSVPQSSAVMLTNRRVAIIIFLYVRLLGAVLARELFAAGFLR
jgi:hypothetical protein